MKKVKILVMTFGMGVLMSCSDSQNNQTESGIRETVSTTEDCPHCNGIGERANSITGNFTSCSSCGGDGKVTQEQYGRLSK